MLEQTRVDQQRLGFTLGLNKKGWTN
jgi:hypothetical protein